MTLSTAPAEAAEAAPAELLAWDPEVHLHGESLPPAEGRRGFALRLHQDPSCTDRLVPGRALVARRYEQARADDLCRSCCAAVVAASSSSVLRRLRDAEATLRRMLASARDTPAPRDVVHCRALRFEAEQAVSVHPAVQAYAAEVAVFAGEVLDALRAGLLRTFAPRR